MDRKVLLLTIGSYGDVLPYVALGIKLQEKGYPTCIATHLEFKPLIEEAGLQYEELAGKGEDLIRFCVKQDSLSALSSFPLYFRLITVWFHQILALVPQFSLVLSVPSIPGYPAFHVCQKYQIPFQILFTMPWTRTRAFPHPFLRTTGESGPVHSLTYPLIERTIWTFVSPLVQQFRRSLGLQEVQYDCLLQAKVPFIYGFSSLVVDRPGDWPDQVKMTGFWNIGTSLPSPPVEPDLETFLAAGDQPIYIGFGSITGIDRPKAFFRLILLAVEKTGVRAIIAPNSLVDRDVLEDLIDQIDLAENVLISPYCPHTWLFPRVAAVCHHGGAGTTYAGLAAGKPTIIISFFGDQYFWGTRIVEKQVGYHFTSSDLTKNSGNPPDPITRLSQAFTSVTTDLVLRDRAKALGDELKREDGVGQAVDLIRDLS